MPSDTALYLALARQDALFRQLDVVSNNAANVNTDGFQAQKLYFKEFLTEETNKRDITFANDTLTLTNFSQGNLKATYRQLDAAIEGDGFFGVDTPEGQRFTRKGHFFVGEGGILVNEQGYPVSGGVTLTPEDVQITIGEDGTVFAGESREPRGQIGVFGFDNPYLLKRMGNGLYRAGDGQQPAPVELGETTRVVQSMLEGSNVNEVNTVTELVKLSRAGGSTARILSDVRELQRNTVDTFLRQSQ